MPTFSRKKASQTRPMPSSNLIPIEDLPGRRPYGSGGIVNIKGRVRMPDGVYSHGSAAASGPSAESTVFDTDEEDAGADGVRNHEEGAGVEHEPVVNTMEQEKRTRKKQRQYERWNEEVLPALLQPYLELQRETESLRNVEEVRKHVGCSGCQRGRLVEVTCMYFQKIEIVMMCTCMPLPLQLLQLGLFPCAPVLPSLAVDMQMLNFVRELFVNAAPNITAWCETLESFLSSLKYKLTTRNTLRARFSNALHWYAALVDMKNMKLRDYINQVRGALKRTDEEDDENTESDNESMDVDDDEEKPQSEKQFPDRPSEYLRNRCPLCFGGKSWSQPEELVDSIVCIDACFTQKRRKAQGQAWQAPREHPETVFISEEEVAEMERKVEEVRPARSNGSAPKAPDAEYEQGMKVPTTVLDGCQESFYAADANRVKASTQFFEDTGLMALLCRHDRVLFLANMKSAGEKQYYALSLLDKFFQHIPEKMRIGVLYDIGCQLHRSCTKHGFLSTFLDRIIFGISVFHAYGHQWPCQLIYHPRKCRGFGLTDGEGCERFWSSIKLLIPSLRVSGKFTRIYTLDTQIKHLDKKSMLGLGQWLKRKWAKTQNRKADAATILEEILDAGVTIDHLRTEWAAQISEQTKPLKRQSSKLADNEIHEILALEQSVKTLKDQLQKYHQMLLQGEYEEGLSFIEVQALHDDLQTRMEGLRKTIAKKKAKLSVDGRLRVDKLLKNEFLKTRMNALALKQRIRDRLRNRKFELENLERAYRKTTNQQKLDQNAQDKIRRKEPGILSLVKKYNKLCIQLHSIIAHNKAPRGAIAPIEIQEKGVFKLDVDDDIWQDIGLTADDDDLDTIPDWLGNEAVRQGIKALIEVDRCDEELRRLKHERAAMQDWMQEEWAILQQAIEWSLEDVDVTYQLLEQKDYLLHLCVLWMPAVRVIPCTVGHHWGPTMEELDTKLAYEKALQALDQNDDDESDDLYNVDDLEEAALLNDLEDLAIGEGYRL